MQTLLMHAAVTSSGGWRRHRLVPGAVGAALWVALLVLPAAVQAQGVIDRNHVPSDERVDPLERRRDDIDGNNIRATITNWTQTAQSGNPADYWYEWPKNTNRIYVALTQLWVGAEVTTNVPGQEGETIYITDISDFRQNSRGEENSWTFEPIRGYVNPAGSEFGIAQSDDPTSWPPFWPDKQGDAADPGWAGSWNGFFGKNIENADQEFFYKAGDDQYDRYLGVYRPDSTDATRGGLGLIVDSRILAWSQILIDDVVFMIQGVKNDGTEDLNSVGFSVWLADCAGGDCADDVIFFDLLEDVAFMTDQDGVGDQNFGSDPVGAAAIAFLETPGNAVDRIDNDADGSTSPDCPRNNGECNSPVVPEAFLTGEDPANGIDDNGNGLIDENQTHIAFSGEQVSSVGVGYADYIDNDGDGEPGSPVVTAEMVAEATSDAWGRWPPNPAASPIQQRSNGRPIVHLVGLDESDIGRGFRDHIDNDGDGLLPHTDCVVDTPPPDYLAEVCGPVVTQEMIDQAAGDPYGRYRVPGTDIVLFALGPEDLGKPYADGIDNDGDGAVDEGIDEGIDEMIDESRADGIDNDGDWNPLRDDTGLDGNPFSGDPGDGDGQPTSGAGTPFPGEKNIDVTDVSESDQIGITNVQLFAANSLNLSTISDRALFRTYMVPGDFDTERPAPGDNDLVVSSGLFPLRAGQTERISLSVQLGLTQDEALAARDNALDAYSEDYQFAQAPNTPTVTAVPGDGRVTLYWDTDAEDSVDPFLESLGLPARDFEGYRIYRSTDPAFLDPLTITDGRGNLTFRKPIAQFDLINGNEGFHPVDINGIKFYLGNDRQDEDLGEAANGLAHVFVDTTVTNGLTYYYAVTAYDFGAPSANIAPTETPIRIRRLPDGTIETGPNVVEVVPTPPVAGYRSAELESNDGLLIRTKGFTSSRIGYRIVDPRVYNDGDRFRVVFEDTLIRGTLITPDTLTTKNFSLINLTTGDTLLNRSRAFLPGQEFPPLDDQGRPIGFELLFSPERLVQLDNTRSGWNPTETDGGVSFDTDIYSVSLRPYLAAGFVKGLRNPLDYRVEVVGPGEGQSTELEIRRRFTLPSRPTNVRVYRIEPDGQGGTREVEVDYAFWDLTGDDFVGALSTEPATFSAGAGESDRIIIYERQFGAESDARIITWEISLNFTETGKRNPAQGDVARIVTRKPFLASDEFEFTAFGPRVDAEAAAAQLENIRVVPNPYVATNRFEPLNPFSTGRGPRVIKFINLPPQATVRIFTVGGRFVRELRLNEGVNDPNAPEALMNGTLTWDLQSEDNLTVAYGLYLYHVEAPGIGETTGTFAIIK